MFILAENNDRAGRQLLIISRSFDFATILIRLGAIVWIASFIRDAFIASVGQATDVSVFVRLFFSEGNDYGVPWIVAIILFGWGTLEHRLRRQKTEQLHGRIVELESKLDPERSSSQLLPSGETNPRHKL